MKLQANLPPLPGIGLKPEHYAQVLQPVSASTSTLTTGPAWLEVHPQNYFGAGGPPHRWLTAIAESYPLSFHSVGLSLGSAGGVDAEELDRLADLCARYEPASVSDHLSWSGSANNRYPDLLPVPYTEGALRHFAQQVGHVQDRLKRPILIENPSRYLAFSDDDMSEAQFLHLL
ncbi:multinuclear nonheme iron-dependent oxidase, partial [Blastomonas sp.]|uniref:multinuclear nonheme iron-dependent oxidase n=1 Tax=Blastomonas sp. TaxID=1909299 RepID=UPI00406AA7AE